MNFKKQESSFDELFTFEMLHFLSMKSSEKQRKLTGKAKYLAPSSYEQPDLLILREKSVILTISFHDMNQKIYVMNLFSRNVLS